MARWDKIVRQVDGKEIPGLFHHAFIHNGDTYYLADIKVYQDGMVDCWGLVDTEGFQQKVNEGWVVTSLPEKASVCVSLLVDLKATHVQAFVKEGEFVKEVLDDIEWLNGRPTVDEECLQALARFQEKQTEEARQALKVAYEAIPEHNRRFVLGDMDVNDIPIRMILYGEDEMENWSHRIVARQLGDDPLPHIEVPGVSKPKRKRKNAP